MTTTSEASSSTLRRDIEIGNRQSLCDIAAEIQGKLGVVPVTLFVRSRASAEDIAALADATHCNVVLLEKGAFQDVQLDEAEIGWIEMG